MEIFYDVVLAILPRSSHGMSLVVLLNGEIKNKEDRLITYKRRWCMNAENSINPNRLEN